MIGLPSSPEKVISGEAFESLQSQNQATLQPTRQKPNLFSKRL